MAAFVSFHDALFCRAFYRSCAFLRGPLPHFARTLQHYRGRAALHTSANLWLTLGNVAGSVSPLLEILHNYSCTYRCIPNVMGLGRAGTTFSIAAQPSDLCLKLGDCRFHPLNLRLQTV